MKKWKVLFRELNESTYEVEAEGRFEAIAKARIKWVEKNSCPWILEAYQIPDVVRPSCEN